MNYLLDTVAVVRHFSGNPAIGAAAKTILKNANNENLFYISVISLMEIMYLSEKNRISLRLGNTLD
jgi:PIN domain nuclease of toxin-antitoxin system